ncbi:MAG: hypothetical protein R2778_15115 [Saprospiraceae bacterium]
MSGRTQKPHEKHEIVMYLQKEWYALRWRKSVLEVAEDGYDTLDTDLINDLVINQIFKIMMCGQIRALAMWKAAKVWKGCRV